MNTLTASAGTPPSPTDSPTPPVVDPTAAWRAARDGAIVTEAPGVALLAIEGADGASFLQGQLSNDVQKLAPGQGQWTTYSSPKGRMLATIFLVRDGNGERYWALVASDLVEPVRKRLSMFVLRAKVRIAAAPVSILGVGGPLAGEAVGAALGVTPGAGTMAESGDDRVVRLPDGRFIVVATAPAQRVLEALATRATPAGSDVWSWLAIRAGVPLITAATQDLFVAQTANWDALGAIDFRKGCYTGQEIVARTQHLGRIKERLFGFVTAAAPPAPGTRLYGEPFGDQAAGTVVNSAPDPDGGSRFLAVAQIQAAESGPLALGAPDGPIARREALPYVLPEPTAPRGRIAR